MEEALNDPEGQALVGKILDPANPRLTANQVHVNAARGHGETAALKGWVDEIHQWQDVGTLQGPLEMVSVDIGPTLLAETFPVVTPKKITAAVDMTWQDVSHDFMAVLLGYSSAAEMRKAEEDRRRTREMAQRWSEHSLVWSKMMATPPAVDVTRVKWSAGHNVDINLTGSH